MTLPEQCGKSIAVWGKGKLFDCLYEEIKNEVSVRYIIESRPSVSRYRNIPVIPVSKLPEEIKDVIVIPYFDLDLIRKKMATIKPGVKLTGLHELLRGSVSAL